MHVLGHDHACQMTPTFVHVQVKGIVVVGSRITENTSPILHLTCGRTILFGKSLVLSVVLMLLVPFIDEFMLSGPTVFTKYALLFTFVDSKMVAIARNGTAQH